jgi:DNA-directed RNA polymerase subunit RPC12/RpoP
MTNPDEFVTLYKCRGCGVNSLLADAETLTKDGHDMGSQICCQHCGSWITADEIHDYVAKEVTENAE